MRISKKILSMILMMVMTACLMLPVFAADGSVSYVGGAEKFIFAPGCEESPTNLFGNFTNVMPGDSLTQKIFVKNDASNQVMVKLYMRSLGAQEETDEFLSQMKLSVKQEGTTDLFDAPANETAQLTDWVYLGTVYSGGNVLLDVTLDVPITMSNEFQNAVGYIDWEFKAEEIPNEKPKTGDESNLMNWMVLMIVSITVIGALIFIQTTKRKSN